MSGVIVVIIFTIIAVAEGLPLWRKNKKRDFIVFFIVWILTFAYAFPIAIGINMPNPATWLYTVLKPLLPITL